MNTTEPTPETTPSLSDRVTGLISGARESIRSATDAASQRIDDRRSAKTRDELLLELGAIYAAVLKGDDDATDAARRDEIVSRLDELDLRD